ncbi:hypothetical protein O3P69_016286 [Scylla paramamosain]|uniref:Uncharacterized protein n=1 Tax=Scylla paramamosain TaxID=85552 RepID=A0AAW0S9Z3_SCYPA
MRDMERKFKRDIEDILGTFAKNPVDLMYGSLAVESSVLLECGREIRVDKCNSKKDTLIRIVSVVQSSGHPSYGNIAPPLSPWQVGFLDIDICGPSQPQVLGTAEEKVHSSGVGWSPVTKTAVFPATTGMSQLAEDTEMPLLGQLPLDPRVAQACDEGTNIPTQEPDAAVTQAYKDIANTKQAACLQKFALCDAALSPQPGTAYSGTSQHPTAGLFTEEIAGTFEVVFIPDRVQTPDSMK